MSERPVEGLEKEKNKTTDIDGLSARLDAIAAAGRKKNAGKSKRSAGGKKQSDLQKPSDSSRLASVRAFFTDLWEDIKNGVKTQRFKRGSTATVLTALFLAFVVLTNLVAVKLTDRYAFLSPDMTANKVYTLSDVSIGLVKNLDMRVEIDILATEYNCMNPSAELDPYGHIPIATELIKRYALYSDNLRVEFIDLDQNPGFLDLLGEYRDSVYDYSVVVRAANGRIRVSSFYEMLPALTASVDSSTSTESYATSSVETTVSSLIKTVTLDVQPAVAYLDVLGGGDYVGNLLNSLYTNGYEIESSATFDFGFDDIPENVQLAIIAAPQYDITKNQLIQLSDWLYNDGKLGHTLLVLSSSLSPELPNLKSLLEEWGMTYTRSSVYEGDSSRVMTTLTPDVFSATYMDSEYINDTLSAKATYVAGALDIGVDHRTLGNNIVVNGILCTSANGFVLPIGEDYSSSKFTAADGAVRYIMAQSTYYSESDEGGRRSDIVLAPCSLCTDEYFASAVYSNFSLVMSICNQRCGIIDQNLDIPAKSISADDINIGSGSIVALTVIFGYVLPLGIAIAGVVVYLRRRRL